MATMTAMTHAANYDSTYMQDVMIEQMLVGVLFLAPLAATLPTTWLLHCAVASVHAGIALLRMSIYAAACMMDSGCVYRLLCWAAQPLLGGAILGAEPDVTFLGEHTVSIVSDDVAGDDTMPRHQETSVRHRTSPQGPAGPDQAVKPVSKSHDEGNSAMRARKDWCTCPASYYRVDAGYVSFMDALRPGWSLLMTELSYIQPWFSIPPWNREFT